MAASTSPADDPHEPPESGVGLAHLTVVPANFDPDDAASSTDADDTEDVTDH